MKIHELQIRVIAVLVLLNVAIGATLGEVNASTAEAPNDCIVYAYVHDGFNHWSLLNDNSSVVGTHLTVRTDCDGEFEVWINGQARMGGEYLVSVPITTSTTFIELKSAEWNVTFSDLTVFPSGDFTTGLNQQYEIPDPITLSVSDLANGKAWTVFLSALILWFIVTVLGWKLVNFYIDRYHCSEVM